MWMKMTTVLDTVVVLAFLRGLQLRMVSHCPFLAIQARTGCASGSASFRVGLFAQLWRINDGWPAKQANDYALNIITEFNSSS
jgi:hypothetical protein